MARKPLTKEQRQKREQSAFARRIQTTFKNAGFVYVPTKDVEHKFGNKTGELDQVFVFENVILICEDTIATSSARDHLKNKKLLADEIQANKKQLITWLKETHPDRFESFDDYHISRYKIFFLYFTKNKLDLTESDLDLFQPIRVVENSTLSYFHKITQNIKYSARPEVFRFLKLTSDDIGTTDSSSSQKKISTTIIHPTENTGLKNGARIVSFMLSAETLLRNSYVLRKDNWENSIQLYQRLIERDRIQSIRRHLASKETTFFNNIIVSLPSNLSFEDANGKRVELDETHSYDGYKMLIPDEFNSICVIDGQHRIFAHYEGVDALEPKVSKLRKKFHLLVTGLIFPQDMGALERRKYESDIFLDINSNARQVPADVLLFIETLKDPYSDLGIARQVLAGLNSKPVFRNLFQLSLMEDSKIKIASIIKYALRYLVDISDAPDKQTLFTSWSRDDEVRKTLLKRNNEALLDEYIAFIVTTLDHYFGALKRAFTNDWKDVDSKILSTTSINGFLIALRRSLDAFGVKDHEFYHQKFSSLEIDFSKNNFEYTSSQYNKFSKLVLVEAFGLKEQDEEWILVGAD